MREIILIIFLLICSSLSCAFSSELQCSVNGTDVYYINGILAKDYQTTNEDRKNIKRAIVDDKLIDSAGLVNYKLIYNPSNGPLYDMAELYASDYYYRTGRRDGFSLFMKDRVLRLNEIQNTPRILNMLSFLIPPYYKILKSKGERLFQKQIENKYKTSPMTYQQLQDAKSSVVDAVLTNINSAIRDRKKVIFIPHSQGNAIVKEAYKRTISISESYRDYVRDYTGVLHVASPVQNLSPAITNVSSYLLSNDWIVNLAKELFPELGTNAGTHVLVQSSVDPNSPGYDEFNHEFSQVYINPNNMASDGLVVKDMRTIFREKVIGLAQQLKDNCIYPNINVTSPEATGTDTNMIISGSTGPSRSISIKIRDIAVSEDSQIALAQKYDHSKTIFTWKLERFYSGAKLTETSGSKVGDLDLLMAVPYRDLNYVLTVYAENEFRFKSEKKVTFVLNANLPPTLSVTGQRCILDSDGYSGGVNYGQMEYIMTVSDDQYSLDNKTIVGTTTDGSVTRSVSDGIETASATVENTCPVVKRIYHYDVWSTCDAMYLMNYCRNYVEANCTAAQGDDSTTLINSGGQFNEIHYMDEKNNFLFSVPVPGANQPGQSLSATIFDYNSKQDISFSIPNKCPEHEVYSFERGGAYFYNISVFSP